MGEDQSGAELALLMYSQHLIERPNNKTLLRHIYFDKRLLILHKAGLNADPWILFNEQIVRNRYVMAYLKELSDSKSNLDIQSANEKVIDKKEEETALAIIGFVVIVVVILAVLISFLN